MTPFNLFGRRAVRAKPRKAEVGRLSLGVEELEPRVVPSTTGVPSTRLLIVPPPSVTQTYSLVTLSGQSASMFMGGEQPVPQSDGHGGTAVVFEPFGAQLQFVPVVLPDNSINLQLDIQQAALSESGELKGNGTDVEGRTTLAVHTTVNLKGGQTLVLVQDRTVPFQVAVTPQVLPGSTPMVLVTVMVVSPSGLIEALPESVRPTSQGQAAITDTYQLTAVSGQTANLLVGGEQPLPGTMVNFERYGAQVNVLPIVLDNGTVRLDIEAKETALNNASGSRILGTFVAGHVALDVRSSVELASGQTIVLGADQGLPFEVLVTPQVIAGSAKLVSVSVKVIEPAALAAALPAPARPTTQGQTPVRKTYELTALSGDNASLFVGGERPLPGPGANLERFGAQLSVLPTVLSDGTVRLDIEAEESALNRVSGSQIHDTFVPGQIALDVRTSVAMGDGQTLVLGADQGLPFEALVTPHVIAVSGSAQLVSMTVTVIEPSAFVTALPPALRPAAAGSPSISQTFTVSALSGNPASLIVGGTQLNVLPVVTDSGAILLTIEAQQSAFHKSDRIILDLQTTAELLDGQTLVLGQDQSLPFEVLVTPNVSASSQGELVSVTVTIVSPASLQ
jgi:hypothetical protein